MAAYTVEIPNYGTYDVEGVDTPEQAYAAAQEQVDTEILAGDLSQEDANQPRSMSDEIGIGVDLAQQDAYSLGETIGKATGNEWLQEKSREGIERQDEDLAEYDYQEGEDLSMTSDFVRNGLGMATGAAAIPVAMIGGVPAAVAGAGLGAISVASNLGESINKKPEATTGERMLDVAGKQILDTGLGVIGKTAKPAAQAAKPVLDALGPIASTAASKAKDKVIDNVGTKATKWVVDKTLGKTMTGQAAKNAIGKYQKVKKARGMNSLDQMGARMNIARPERKAAMKELNDWVAEHGQDGAKRAAANSDNLSQGIYQSHLMDLVDNGMLKPPFTEAKLRALPAKMVSKDVLNSYKDDFDKNPIKMLIELGIITGGAATIL